MLDVKNVCKSYSKPGSLLGKKRQEVLKDISFAVKTGECVGLIGESGSGKSTLGRLILGLERPDSGEIRIEGAPVSEWKKSHGGEMSVVFQDYTTSANPRFTVEEIIAEPLLGGRKSRSVTIDVRELLTKVELSTTLLGRYLHELSGGQLQRVCLARAISTRPRFMVLDESLSSLDVSVQAQILTLLRNLKGELHMTYLFIAHDLQTITNLCNQVIFLYQGEIAERLPSSRLAFAQNDYARRLLNSVILFDG
ncbi:MAG TPA: dipeptide/oligopeptide/nickel ABC transporter ATP-binding protein [Patescibacteria group bacterium]|nr:dipeptide/oligopeptide/nickel ABC transporter ATP-binding protein [Patescibacteria group bacterium]